MTVSMTREEQLPLTPPDVVRHRFPLPCPVPSHIFPLLCCVVTCVLCQALPSDGMSFRSPANKSFSLFQAPLKSSLSKKPPWIFRHLHCFPDDVLAIPSSHFMWFCIIVYASLVAQRLKRLPAMRETWVRSLGQEDLLEEEGNSNPLQYFGLENPMDRGSWQATVHGVAKELGTT